MNVFSFQFGLKMSQLLTIVKQNLMCVVCVESNVKYELNAEKNVEDSKTR